MKVKIKKMHENAVVPQYAKEGDAGLDLTATSKSWNPDTQTYVYGTGLAVEIPKGYVGLIFPRSSNYKKDVYMTNHVGVIDSGYRGEMLVCFKDRDEHRKKYPYEVGDRIAQLIILPYPTIEFEEADELSETERGAGGHGSTGK